MKNVQKPQYLLGMAVLLTAFAFSGYVFAAENTDSRLSFADNRHCVFAGQKAVFSLIYDTGDTSRRPTQLQAHLRVNRRNAARGKAKLKPTQNGMISGNLRIDIPPVKEGVVMPATLEIVIPADEADNADDISSERKLYLFHPDPFSSRQVWLKKRKIRLFDPVGKTAECLESANIPHERIHNKARIDDLTDGVLIIGAGVSLHKQRRLLKNALTAAEGGAFVLFLGVEEGQAKLPGISGMHSRQPERVVLRGDDVVKSFDKRFDILTRAAASESRPRPLMVKTENDNIVGSFSQTDDQNTKRWSWFMSEHENGGRFALSGLPIVENWKTSPVPRYFLLEILKDWEKSGTVTD